MHPLVKAAPVLATMATIGSFAATRSAPQRTAAQPDKVAEPGAVRSKQPVTRCPSGSLSLGPSTPCTPLPSHEAPMAAREAFQRRETETASHPADDVGARVGVLPERPNDWLAYQLPVPLRGTPSAEPKDSGRGESSTLRFPTTAGCAVQLTELENQVGDTSVVAVGPLRGITVVTHHRVTREGRDFEYLVFHGQLERPGPNIRVGATLSALSVVGFVSDYGSVLAFEVRELRVPLAAPIRTLAELEKPSLAFTVDPRNVLPLRR